MYGSMVVGAAGREASLLEQPAPKTATANTTPDSKRGRQTRIGIQQPSAVHHSCLSRLPTSRPGEPDPPNSRLEGPLRGPQSLRNAVPPHQKCTLNGRASRNMFEVSTSIGEWSRKESGLGIESGHDGYGRDSAGSQRSGCAAVSATEEGRRSFQVGQLDM